VLETYGAAGAVRACHRPLADLTGGLR